jgi:hypothetical protein
MQKSTILELSRYNSSDKPTAATWTTKLSKPTIIKNGDIIQVRDSFIDCRLIDSQTIEIENDVNLTFNFIYWIERNGIAQYMVAPPLEQDGSPQFYDLNQSTPDKELLNDGLPFMLVNINPDPNDLKSGHPVVETASILIEAGVYERSNLADYITRKMEKIQTRPNTYIEAIEGNSQNFTAGDVQIVSDSDGNFINFSTPYSAPPPSYTICTFQKQLYLGIWVNNEPTAPLIKSCLFYIDTGGNYVPCIFAPLFNNNYIPLPDDGFMFTPCMTNLEDPKMTIQWNGATYYLYDAGFVGSPTIELTYNQENGNGKFNFDYMHTPVVDAEGNQTVGMHIKQQGVPELSPVTYNYSYVTSLSGIMFVNIYDKNNYNPNVPVQEIPLLNQMGFKMSDLIPLSDLPIVFKPSNKISYSYSISGNLTYTPFSGNGFYPYTTRNLLTMGACVSSTNTINIQSISNAAPPPVYQIKLPSSAYLPIVDGYNLVSQPNTEPISASSLPVSSLTAGGHFLIEINAYPVDYIDNEGFRLIKAIVSTYYFAESFASSLEDSLIYQHIGENMVLQSIGVRILNPTTKQESKNLGTNSSVYLQVISPLSDIKK